MDNITHEAISASAGSGKTFQLAHRYIRLLANGIKPERIIALTFSRKAAGEIFDSIIKYMCQAATSEEQAQAMAVRINAPLLCQADFLKLLRSMIASLHRLHISTLDSFSISIIRAFPLELGIGSTFQIMESDGSMALTVRQDVLSRILNNNLVDQSAQIEFMQAFKQATYGKEEKGPELSLDAFIDKYRKHFRSLPYQNRWGDKDFIWPDGSPWLTEIKDVKTAVDGLEQSLRHDDLPEKLARRWQLFMEEARQFTEHSSWKDEIDYLVKKLIGELEGLRNGNAVLKIDRVKCPLSPDENLLALNILSYLIQTELTTALQQTRGIYRVLNQYEYFYENMVCQQGKLTFDDAHYLLAPKNNESGGRILSRIANDDSRLYIDYRLDCKLDHWLLDEFQDTSDLQWEALNNLADEIIQDVSGDRSFFYVGDVKQAIYGWRGGNAQLFGKILDRYGDLIRQRPLNTSFRSSQPIIDTVNQVFAKLPSDLPEGATNQWNKAWQEHQCQEGFVPKEGYTALIEPAYAKNEKPTEENRYHIAASLLKEINPLSKGLSTAILVRSNESGRRLVNYLRTQCTDMPIIHEGRSAIKDNPVVRVLLSLVKLAAHPGDTLAWRHLQMSPFMSHFTRKELHRENLPCLLLSEIQSDGFQDFIRNWGNILDITSPLDSFGRKRLTNMIDAAGEFDASNKPDCNQFLHFIENHQIHEEASNDAVRIMTFHQSKGLGFDIVILPDLQGENITQARDNDFTIARDPLTGQPQWAMQMPRKIIAQADPVLAYQLEKSNESACFDSLCQIYVAMTRAKQGLYMITSYPGKSSQLMTLATLLKTQLFGESKPTEGSPVTIDGNLFTLLFETGHRDWHTHLAAQKPCKQLTESSELKSDFRNQSSHRLRMIRILPSEQVEHKVPASKLFSPAYYRTLEFGSAVHELLQKVSWLEESDIEIIINHWEQNTAIEKGLALQVIEHFRQTLTSKEVQQILSRPEGNCKLWKERRFEVVLDNQWITGAFDRVTIFQDTEERALRADIIDFKSDAIDGDENMSQIAAGYRPQLALYRKALSRLLKLDPSRIKSRLLFTEPGKIYDFD